MPFDFLSSGNVCLRHQPGAIMIKLASCIVTHNSDLARVEETVQSLLNCDVDIHLTIVDNASKLEYQAELKRITPTPLIEAHANRGFSAGHNLGLEKAPKSEYYLVLNPDVMVHKGTLVKLIEFMDEHQDVGLVSPRILNPDGSIQPLNKRLPNVLDLFLRRFSPAAMQRLEPVKRRMDHYIMADLGYDRSYVVPYMSGCFMLFRRSILTRAGLFDDRFFMYLEDADMTHRINQISKAVYFPNTAITHCWSRGSHNSMKLAWVTVQSAFYFFNKWGWRWL